MRPVIEKKRLEIRHIVYIIIIIICLISIGIAVYMQFFKDEKLGVIFGITSEKEDEEYKSLKENFMNIFTNDIDTVKAFTGNVKKIREEEDLVLTAYNIQEQDANYTLDIKIPYFNINENIPKEINKEIKSIFKDKADSIKEADTTKNRIYNIRYKTYINDEILSLVIMSELKEGDNNERIIVKTYNYNLKENKKVQIDEVINKKNIDINNANNQIKQEVNKSQEENLRLRDAGYNVNVRDVESDTYKIQNAEEFFIGQNGYLYVVYPYGNTEFTSEMNVIIFR